ncbi:hypothetical protein RFI_01549 [Reticulomyxa filosa]|uniref:Uncharacterized protein n=1 Tax=Reticulomyxa filosa TaxID=46433 RepID=X6PBT1_RETFI|nr:hypothetical protein RFI_01549 [Reticulomyxa filosa]|eukprot:ETO35514.1 hypothetical protein RFI_01549 [Reticulomyxa filosa]
MGNTTSENTQLDFSTQGKKATAAQAAEEYDLNDKVILVTGANIGIGLETCRTLAEHNATVIMACRDRSKANQARKNVIDSIVNNRTYLKCDLESLSNRIQVIKLDLASLQSIQECVKDFKSRNLKLHCLVNNAGVFMPKFQSTKDNIETTLQVNFLGPFYLTWLLLPYLFASCKNPRVINVTSIMHKKVPLPFADWLNSQISVLSSDTAEMEKNNEKKTHGVWGGITSSNFSINTSYGISKALVILWTQWLHQKFHDGIDLTSTSTNDQDSSAFSDDIKQPEDRLALSHYGKLYVCCIHPGLVATSIGRNIPGGEFLFTNVMKPFIKSPEQGAATIVRCCVLPDDLFESGHFYVDCVPHDDMLLEELKTSTKLKIENRNNEEKEQEQQSYKSWTYADKLLSKVNVDLKKEWDISIVRESAVKHLRLRSS